ncbi:hypothetical protein QE152_g33318 [Popillia japonica]|uniref:Uncharacterized protein n=1 Tax=Popillia japonica TaxID=7064 RepID=A0AAW1IX19_POPJA
MPRPHVHPTPLPTCKGLFRRKTGIDPVDGTVFGGQVYLNNEGGKSFAGIQGINTTTPHKDFVTRAPTKLEHKEAVDHT